MTQIINPVLGLQALREVGYKSTGTALAELVDNSIEANAQDIDIISISKKVKVNNTMSLRVSKVAVLDNGEGMTEDVLADCLSLGWGTRLNQKDLTLGKFGFGLKGSSISQARRVEVYSWQNVDWDKNLTNKIKMACLDIDKIKELEQNELDPLVEVNLPDFAKKFGYKIKRHKSGTLVVWSNIDYLDFRTVVALVNVLNKELCRIYRHYLHDGDFGHKRNICIQDLNMDTGKTKKTELIPNDPLYLISPNNLPEYGSNPTNAKFEKPFPVEVEYEDSSGKSRKSKFTVHLSVAQPEIQGLGGASVQGRHYQHNCGISFVRSGREIDFGSFGFISASDPRNRWWGIEVRFNPELDKLFGVTNSKQSVNNVKAFEESMKKELFEDSDRGYKATMLIDLNKTISESISEMMKTITGRGVGARTEQVVNPVKDKVNKILARDTRTKTESKEHGAELTADQKIAEILPFILNDDTSLDSTKAKEIAKKTVDYQVDLLTDEWPGNLFLERKAAGATSFGKINRNTAFYEKFWKKLEDDPDSSGFEALSIILMSLIRAEDELQVLMEDKNALSTFRQTWSKYVDLLLDKAAD